jgi:hypothetical protein
MSMMVAWKLWCVITNTPFGREEMNGMEWKDHSLIWEFKGREWNEILIPPYSLQTPIFISPKLEGIGGNEILFNEIFTKTPKMPLNFFLNTRLSLILHVHFLTSSCATTIISNLGVFSLFFFGYHQYNSKINKNI